LFSIIEPIDIDINNVLINEEKIMFNFSFEYNSKMNSILQGIDIKEKIVKFQFPGYSAIFPNTEISNIKSSFQIDFKESKEMDIPLDANLYTIGEAIKIPSISDILKNKKMCVGILSNNNKVYKSMLSLDCDAFSITTSGINIMVGLVASLSTLGIWLDGVYEESGGPVRD